MRETPSTLRALFFLVGAMSVVAFFMTFLLVTSSQIERRAILVSLLLLLLLKTLFGCVYYFYIGDALPEFLRDKPELPLRFASAAIIVSALSISIPGFLVNVYFWYQIRRLVKEATVEPERQVLA